jgi:hypothetical protein
MSIHDELEEIRLSADGVLRPEAVVDYARSPETALHSLFTWDDSEAAHQYRLWQAREIIRVRIMLLPGHTKPIRAYVSLTSDRIHPQGGYRAIVDVLGNPEHHEQMVADALREFQIFEAKYRALRELQPLFAAAENVRRRADRKAA